MQAIVIFESLTGNTAKAGRAIADQLTEAGIPTVASPITAIDLEALSGADLVIVGSWVDGIFIAGQRPGREGRLKKMPVIDGKQAAVYCTYALKDGKTLEKLSAIVERRGGDVIGGYAIRRDRIERDATSFVDRLLGALSANA
ncbi:MAG: flavodoxin family protein [Acidimicrobiales bacterium]